MVIIDDRIEAVILELDEFVRDYHSEYGEYGLPIGDNPSMISMRAIVRDFFYTSLTQLARQNTEETMSSEVTVTATGQIEPAFSPAPIQPMQGSNELVLSDETMQRAVEYWLNANVLRSPVRVYGIVYDRKSETYEVVFEPRDKG